MTHLFIGIAIGMVCVLVGYKIGYRDGQNETVEFLFREFPEETQSVFNQIEETREFLEEELQWLDEVKTEVKEQKKNGEGKR